MQPNNEQDPQQDELARELKIMAIVFFGAIGACWKRSERPGMLRRLPGLLFQCRTEKP